MAWRFMVCVIAGALFGCAGYYKIQTDGVRAALPDKGVRVVVWGWHESATGAATNWLQKQGLTIVERALLQAVFEEQRIRLTHSPDDEAEVLRIGKILGAETLIFVQGVVHTGAYGGASVSVRGVDVETATVQWSGTARYTGPLAYVDFAMSGLACEALATAWGFRKPGPHYLHESTHCMTPSGP